MYRDAKLITCTSIKIQFMKAQNRNQIQLVAYNSMKENYSRNIERVTLCGSL